MAAAAVAGTGILAPVRRFMRATGGGATSIVSLAVAVITVGGTAVIVDHNWLVDQQDVLKNASDAAAIATTIEMERQRGTMSPDQLEAFVQDVAHTYALLNLDYLSGDRLERARETLAVKVTPDLATSRVNVVFEADLGGTLLARHLPVTGHYGGPKSIGTFAAAELLLTPVELVLAIDISSSMSRKLDGTVASLPSQSRMEIVKSAAHTLVDILHPNPTDRIAIGVVPWQGTVRLPASQARQWDWNDWAVYPQRRNYPATFVCRNPRTCTNVSETQDLPYSPPEPWQECVDEQRVGSDGIARYVPTEQWLDLPATLSFAQSFYFASYGHTYECASRPYPPGFRFQFCYQASGRPAQQHCPPDTPPMLPLTSDITKIRDAIDGLLPIGALTYSSLGILWGQRMLTHTWRNVWGGAIHPVDPDVAANSGTRKVIVLLTDGEDNQCGKADPECRYSASGIARRDACAIARAQGTKIFVVAAFNNVKQSVADSLRDCSSEVDDPDTRYTFLNTTDEASLRGAFEEIAEQLRVVRRLY